MGPRDLAAVQPDANGAFGALSTAHALALIAVQTAGGVTGTVVANPMFDLDACRFPGLPAAGTVGSAR